MKYIVDKDFKKKMNQEKSVDHGQITHTFMKINRQHIVKLYTQCNINAVEQPCQQREKRLS